MAPILSKNTPHSFRNTPKTSKQKPFSESCAIGTASLAEAALKKIPDCGRHFFSYSHDVNVQDEMYKRKRCVCAVSGIEKPVPNRASELGFIYVYICYQRLECSLETSARIPGPMVDEKEAPLMYKPAILCETRNSNTWSTLTFDSLRLGADNGTHQSAEVVLKVFIGKTQFSKVAMQHTPAINLEVDLPSLGVAHGFLRKFETKT